MAGAKTTEESIIQWIQRHAPQRPESSVRLGIGDDCAIIRPPSEAFEMVVTTDQVIENKHFLRDSHPAGALGRKLLARGLSDLAAMGAAPAWMLLSLGLPDWARGDWLEQFLSEMFDSIRALDPGGELVLAGGDLSAAERFTGHITACGTVPRGRALQRAGGRIGDRIYVSGALGGSALGLQRLLAGGVADETDPAVDRHLRPTPLLALGSALREAGVSAAIDLSDGLSSDLGRLAKASGLQAVVDAGDVPLFPGASRQQALHGGEEYELLFTAPAGLALPERLAGSDIRPIGELRAGEGVVLREQGRETPLAEAGFDHFRSANSSS
ncbi:MAG: thiamine-phosphate kinase [Acidobacteria bacterium]|nr:thiamine-phosphate kinase [Acidobacteriota bacterium]